MIFRLVVEELGEFGRKRFVGVVGLKDRLE